MSREKSDSENRRVIVDLSWPKGHSINDAVESDNYMGVDFLLTLPTIDNILNAVKKFGKSCYIAKIDVSRAFRHVPLDPKDINHVGLFWKDYFIEKSLCFGFKHGSQLFQRLSQSVRFIMSEENFHTICYIDDYVLFGSKEQCSKAFHRLSDLVDELGFTISTHKNVMPTTEAVCLGILINTVTSKMSVPPKKLQEIKHMVENWSHKSTCSKNQLQSLLGSLLYVSKCVKHARFFLNRLLQTLRANNDKKFIKLGHNFQRDITWFKKFVEKFNGTTFFIKEKVQGTVFLDACLSGMGAIHEDEVYHLKVPKNFKSDNIATLEMLNILVAIRVWARKWHSKKITIYCDNEAVVSVLNTGKTRDVKLAAISRNIFMISAENDITFQFSHVKGKNNTVADLLSRWTDSESDLQKLHTLVPKVSWLKISEKCAEIDYEI